MTWLSRLLLNMIGAGLTGSCLFYVLSNYYSSNECFSWLLDLITDPNLFSGVNLFLSPELICDADSWRIVYFLDLFLSSLFLKSFIITDGEIIPLSVPKAAASSPNSVSYISYYISSLTLFEKFIFNFEDDFYGNLELLFICCFLGGRPSFFLVFY